MGADKGWARRTAVDGVVSDPTPDLYDYAFALFALGWYHKATQDGEALRLAHQTLDLLDRDFRHPLGAFHHEIPAPPPRQQNPHMHLFEAALALAETSRDDRFMSLANEIRGYFADRMFRSDLQVLPEFYEEDLTPAQGDRGRWIEPGHHMEWAWILAQHQILSGTDNRDFVRDLMNFAETYGFAAETGLTVNGVRDDGLILDGGSRTWPNTERLKGWIALQELLDQDAAPAVEASLNALFKWHLNHEVAGCWQDSFNANGEPQASTVPASTLYHVFLGFSEVLRVFPPTQTGTAGSQ
jgi:N-acylglucosamine 2-epimerase/mannose-6-phosphate isomerase